MAVDKGDRDFSLQILLRQRQRRRPGGNNDACDVIAQQLSERRGELLRIVGVHQQRHKTVERQLVDQRRQQLTAERVIKSGGDDADKVATAGVHRAGDDIHLITQRFRRGENLLAGFFRHRRAGGKGAGNCGTGDASEPGNVLCLNPFFFAHSIRVRVVLSEPAPTQEPIVGTEKVVRRYHINPPASSGLTRHRYRANVRLMPDSESAPPGAAK